MNIKKVLVFILLFTSTICNAYKTRLDSLLDVNINYLKTDSVKVYLLNTIALEYQKTNPEKGIEFADKATEVAQQINYSAGINTAEYVRGINKFAQIEYVKVAEQYQKLILEIANENVGVQGVDSKVGKVHVNLSDYPKALNYLFDEKKYHESSNNKSAITRSFNAIGNVYLQLSNLPLALENFQKAMLINEKEDEKTALASTYQNIGKVYFELEQNSKASEYYNKSLAINLQNASKNRLAANYFNIGNIFLRERKFTKALSQYQSSLAILYGDENLKAKVLNNLGNVYDGLNENIIALNYFQKALLVFQNLEKENSEPISNNNNALSATSLAQQQKQKADFIITTLDVKSALAKCYQSIGSIYSKINDLKKAFTFFNISKTLASQLHTINIESEALKSLSFAYQKIGRFDTAYVYFTEYITLRDSIVSDEKQKEIAQKEMQFAFDRKESEYKLQQQITDEKLKQQVLQAKQQEQLLLLRKKEFDLIHKQKELERLAYLKTQAELQTEQSKNSEKEEELKSAHKERQRLSELQAQQEELTEQRLSEQKTIRNSLIGGAALLLILLLVLVNRFRLKQKSESELNLAYKELKQTQQQLLQQEKLASLGELTAGIAHEIKNPLNFVNNFAEISASLIDELNETDDVEEQKEILNDIKTNLQKINHHGKRADSIVQNMLQHSRTNSGEMELVDLNKLVNEYADLAFHGMRATNNSFNCNINKNFDSTLPPCKIIQQDVSRVILNILNNAFYAVREKAQKPENTNGYKPTVEITTHYDASNKMAIIKLHDNGLGMSEAIKQKIFEPFFTTKPTGQGTGLGLSLTYDIITKSHAGKLNVTSQEGEFTEFEIMLPV